MDMCSGGDTAHEEVAYEGRNCPVCEKIDDYNELQKENENLKEEKQNLEAKLEEG